jgi:segregation and condensation protein A
MTAAMPLARMGCDRKTACHRQIPFAPGAPAPSTRPVVAEADYRIKLPVFEGPLDLLLFLIRKNELDIYDIPIATVTKQYLEVIYAMKDLQIEVAGEFFVMAATLMEIKSRMLLPKHQQAVDPNADEDDLDPRWELVHQLLQYKKFKEAAGNLGQMALDAQNMLPRPGSAFSPSSERPLQHVDRIEVWNSFNLVLRRLAEKLVVGEIHAEQVTVADQMEYVLDRIKTEKSFVFSQLFPERITLRRLVATFLAVLELTRLKKLRVEQTEAFADILCIAVEEIPLETPPEPATVAKQDEESHPSP